MIPGIVASAGGEGVAGAIFRSSDYGALSAIANNTSSSQSAPAGSQISFTYNAYDPSGIKGASNQTFTIPSTPNPNLVLARYQISAYLNASGIQGQMRRSQAADPATFVGFPGVHNIRPLRTGDNSESGASAIIELTPGDSFRFYNAAASAETMINGGSRNWMALEIIKPGTRYTLAFNSAAVALSANVTTIIPFTTAAYRDSLGTHDETVSTTQFVVPAGTSGVLRVQGWVAGTTAGTHTLGVAVRLNGGVIGFNQANMNGGTPACGVIGHIIRVVPGDVITLTAISSSATSVNGWICIEELPADHRYCLLKKSTNQSVGTGGSNITWDTEVWDPEGAFPGSGTTITLPADAGEFRVTMGAQISSAGLSYEGSSSIIGSAHCATGRLSHNSMSAWRKKTIGATGTVLQQTFGGGTYTGGVTAPHAFLQAEWR